MRCTVATDCDRIMQCGLLLRLQTWRSMTNVQTEEQIKPKKGPKHETREPADRSVVLAHESGRPI